jgi:hypothetical protein
MPAGVQILKQGQAQQPFSSGVSFAPLSDIAGDIAGNIQNQRAADALAMQNAQPGQGIPGAVGPSSVGGPQGPTPLQPSNLSPLSSILNTIFPTR